MVWRHFQLQKHFLRDFLKHRSRDRPSVNGSIGFVDHHHHGDLGIRERGKADEGRYVLCGGIPAVHDLLRGSRLSGCSVPFQSGCLSRAAQNDPLKCTKDGRRGFSLHDSLCLARASTHEVSPIVYHPVHQCRPDAIPAIGNRIDANQHLYGGHTDFLAKRNGADRERRPVAPVADQSHNFAGQVHFGFRTEAKVPQRFVQPLLTQTQAQLHSSDV